MILFRLIKMAEIQGLAKGTLIHRFITSGKKGKCSFCNKEVEKLEGHHITYSPERTISLCHDCHHRVHFWPNRISEHEFRLMLEIRFSKKTARDIISKKQLSYVAMAQLTAPSRQEHIQKHILELNKLFKPKRTRKIEEISKKIKVKKS